MIHKNNENITQYFGNFRCEFVSIKILSNIQFVFHTFFLFARFSVFREECYASRTKDYR